jgi:hypothetical protein
MNMHDPFVRVTRGGAPVILTACLGLVLGLQAAPKLDPTKLPPASSQRGLTFDKDIKPILEQSCVKCHSGDKPKGKLHLDTRDGALKGGESKDAAIVPGKSAQSHLVFFAADLVADMQMPPLKKRDMFPALTKDQVGLLRAWIDQGAK